MPLRHLSFDAITVSQLAALIESKVVENRTIEYKSELPGAKDADKKEFLADVSSFANAAGGDILYGVKAKAGVPTEITGLSDKNFDAEQLRLMNMLYHGVDPRISGVDVGKVELQDNRFVLILRIPQSWSAPHMAAFGGSQRFYSRGPGGKYPLDMHGIRDAVRRSESAMEQLRRFRLERLGRIMANETPVRLGRLPKVVLHLVPFSSFRAGEHIDISGDPHFRQLLANCAPHGSNSMRRNFDGYVSSVQHGQDASVGSYTQLFRNGCTEMVDTWELADDPSVPGSQRIIPYGSFERALICAAGGALRLLDAVGANAPVAVMLTLLGVKDYRITDVRSGYLIDRADLLVPEEVIDKVGMSNPEAARIMRPIFDVIWNACGLDRSPNYDANGNWAKN